MKTSIPFALAVLLVGCKQESSPPTQTTNAPASNPLNAPAEYLGGLTKGHQSAVKTVDVSALNSAIQLFQVDKGRFPKDLNELVTEKFIPKIPEPPAGMKLVYDANAGTVKAVKQ